MTTANSSNRASLLAGLRTGGVRSSVPHTASPAGSFNVPHSIPSTVFQDDEEDDHLPNNNLFINRTVPMTAALDGPNNLFAHQQAPRPMNPNSVPFSPANPAMASQAQLQMQLLQLEVMRMQAMQAQQYQAEVLAQAQIQQQIQQQHHLQSQIRDRLAFNPPATAGPLNNSFDLRAATLSAQMRRANQADHLRSQLPLPTVPDGQVPMTAALGGRFGSRTTSLNPASPSLHFDDHTDLPPTPRSTTVISGGTSLGHLAPNNPHSTLAPSKSDSVSSWRRGGNNNSVLSGNRAVSSPSVKVTPPNEEQVSTLSDGSPTPSTGSKFRPQPLRFNPAVSQPLPTVAIDNADDDTDGETQSSGSSLKSSSPTTPRSSSSCEMPLSPREEASKRLYEGLGIGRPVSATPSDKGAQQTNPSSTVASGHRMASQPTRQPRGPPSGADELGPKNFATRIRRKAIGGLGMLMGARERREFVEAY